MATTNEKPEGVATAPAEAGQGEAPAIKAGEAQPARSAQTPQRDKKPKAKQKKKKDAWVYIGPTIPRTQLLENSVTLGTISAVEERFKAALEKYPAARRLLVAVEDLPAARNRVKQPGNILSKTYADLVSAINS